MLARKETMGKGVTGIREWRRETKEDREGKKEEREGKAVEEGQCRRRRR